jgi:glycerol-3-phosphate acyltransferase PlsY
MRALPWVGLAVITGHIFPVFLKFKGGKGVATAFGVFLALAPQIALAALPVWLCGSYLGGYSSVGALAAFGALPLIALFFNAESNIIFLSVVVSILIYFRHFDNMKRLLKGVERPA